MLAEEYPEFSYAGSLSGTYELMTLKPGEGEYKIHGGRLPGPARTRSRIAGNATNVVSAGRG